MKNYLLFVVSLASLIAAAQPNKSKLDSVQLFNDSLFQFSSGIRSFRGAVSPALKLNSSHSVDAGYRGNNTGYSSVNFNSNVTVKGNNNFGAGQNTVVEAVSGSFGSGADGHIYPSASYSFITNDANDTWGTASALFGFGNDNYTENGFVAGNDNVLGDLNDAGAGVPNKYISSFLFAQMSRGVGSRSFGVGRAIEFNGDDIYAFGTGVDGSRARIVANHPGSFNIGFNNKWIFQIYKEGQIIINGVSYIFPSTAPAVGSVLTYTGSGILEWKAPAVIAKPAQIPQEQPIPVKYIVMTTSGQLLYLVQIK